MIKISFIIPTLDRFNLINQVLKDFSQQKNKNFEIIFVDQSQKINLSKIDFNLLKLTNSKIYHIKNQNASLARNLGINYSTNDYIFILDDDVRIFDRFFVDKIIYYFSFPSTKVISCSINKLISIRKFKYDDLRKLSWIDFPLNLKVNINRFALGRSCALGFKKNLIKNSGNMDINFYKGAFREETEFLHRLANKGAYTSYFHNLNIHHDEHKSGGIRTDKKFFSDLKHCFGDLYFFFKSKGFISNRKYLKHFIFKHFFENKKKIFFNPSKILILICAFFLLLKIFFFPKKNSFIHVKKLF
jgi:glycosyltransferase involved in cell wall biosynthesis